MASKRLVYKVDKWPELGKPEEIYLYVSNGKAHAGRIVICNYRVDFTDLVMQPESKNELTQWSDILLKAWQLREQHDKRGWGSRV